MTNNESVIKNLKLPNKINKAIDMLYAGGFCAYAVGGCVRDLLMGKKPHDYDITTSALPEEVTAVFSNEYTVRPTGIEHGTVTVDFEGEELEITTFRREGNYSDHRHPDEVSFTRNLRDDLVRRDFTVNAMAFNEKEGLCDIFGGVEDIKNRIIRTVGNPQKRFEEDAIRIMRAVRFASYLEFSLEESTALAAKNLADSLSYVAKQRLEPELSKLMCGENVVSVLLSYPEVIFAVMPELKPMWGCSQNSVYHHYDVWRHTVGVVGNMSPKLSYRLSALFHDAGKPQAKKTDKMGFDHFKGHVEISVQIADKVLEDFGYPSELKDNIHFAVLHHEEKIPVSRARMKLLMNCGNEEKMRLLNSLQFADNQAKTFTVGTGRLNIEIDAHALINDIIESGECFSLRQLAVKGNDLVPLGIRGKEIALTLDNLLLEVIAEKVPNEKDALLKSAESIITEIRNNNPDYLINLKEECSSFAEKYGKRLN